MINIIIFCQQLEKLNFKKLIKKVFITFFFLTIIISCNLFEINSKHKDMDNIPFAKKIKVIHQEHNYSREDNYFWLKNNQIH